MTTDIKMNFIWARKDFNVILALLCSMPFLSCSNRENKSIEAFASNEIFSKNRIDQFEPKIINDELVRKLKKVETNFRKKLEPLGDESYYYSLQKQNSDRIEFTTIEVFEEIKETYIIYRIFNKDLVQIASFPVAAIGGEGGYTVLGHGKFKNEYSYIYSEVYHDESEGKDSISINYTLLEHGKVKIDTLLKIHKEN